MKIDTAIISFSLVNNSEYKTQLKYIQISNGIAKENNNLEILEW